MVRKVAAILIFLAALAATAFLAPSGGGLTTAGGVCSPGQHGNPHPGFKPGVCDNK